MGASGDDLALRVLATLIGDPLPVAVSRQFNFGPHLVISALIRSPQVGVALLPDVGSDRQIAGVPTRAEGQQAQLGLDLAAFAQRANVGVLPFAKRHRVVGIDEQREDLARATRVYAEQLVGSHGLLRRWLLPLAESDDLVCCTGVSSYRRQVAILQSHGAIVVRNLAVFSAVLGVHLGRVVHHEDDIRLAVVEILEGLLVPLFWSVVVIPAGTGNGSEAVRCVEFREDGVKSVQLAAACRDSQLHDCTAGAAGAENRNDVAVRFDGNTGLAVLSQEQPHPLILFGGVNVNSRAKRMRRFVLGDCCLELGRVLKRWRELNELRRRQIVGSKHCSEVSAGFPRLGVTDTQRF